MMKVYKWDELEKEEEKTGRKVAQSAETEVVKKRKHKIAAKKATAKRKTASPNPVGKVIHYYDRIGVGIVELKGTLSAGDTVTIKRGDHAFSQAVSSMQINHQPVAKAGKGDVIGLKVKKPTKDGAIVLKG